MAGSNRSFGAAAAIVATLAWCSPALARPGVVIWPTYDRTGPDRHYQVLSELDRGTAVDVLSCDGGWCRIQADLSTAYVEQSAISDPDAFQPLPATQAESDGCFTSHETGYGKGEDWRYCPR